MPARAVSLDDLPDRLPPLVLLVGDEELLIERAISALSAAARRDDPDVTTSECQGGELEGGELHELLGPSLFGDSRLVVIRSARDVRVAALQVLKPYVEAPADGITIVLQHQGGAKGKALLDAARKAKALEIGCAKLTKPDERLDFIRNEVRSAGGRIAPDAVPALLDAVGNDLRELAAVCAQLAGDSGGSITVELVHAFHRGRAEVTGFAVAERVMAGNRVAALEALRSALVLGVPHVLIASALADGVSDLARVATAGRGDPYQLAGPLKMPPWKVRKVQTQVRGWSEPAVRRALGVVAGLNADVKGEAASGEYALERAVRNLLAARAGD